MLQKKEFILSLLHSQVRPALGCTEIGIISLASAKAAKMLKNSKIKSINVTMSPNILRNCIRVGVPSLGRCGLKTIIKASIILKNPEKKLLCLESLTPNLIKKIKKWNEKKDKSITYNVDYNVSPIYTKATIRSFNNDIAEVIIQDHHDNIISAKINGKETISKVLNNKTYFNFDKYVDSIKIKDAYWCCKNFNLKDIQFLILGVNLNKKVCKEGLKNPDKTSISKVWNRMLKNNTCSFGFTKKHWTSDLLGYVCSAVDARMYGCKLPVMTSANSGDHGLTISIPQNIHAKFFKIPKLKMLQAIAFAHFITWKIKSKIGHICSMCGSAISAGAGTIAGIAFQRNWSFKKINDLINMHIVSQFGVICDGAKPSCSFKIMSSLISGFLSMAIVENNGKICDKDGILNKDCENTIDNLKYFSKQTQKITTNSILHILTNSKENI